MADRKRGAADEEIEEEEISSTADCMALRKKPTLDTMVKPGEDLFLTSGAFESLHNWRFAGAHILCVGPGAALFTQNKRLFYFDFELGTMYDLATSQHLMLANLDATLIVLAQFSEDGFPIGLTLKDGRLMVLRASTHPGIRDAELIQPHGPGTVPLQLRVTTCRVVLDQFTGRPFDHELSIENQWQNNAADTCPKGHQDRAIILPPALLALDGRFAVMLCYGPDSQKSTRPFLVRVNHDFDAGHADHPIVNRQLLDEGAFALVYLQSIIAIKLTQGKLYILTQTAAFVAFMGDCNPIPIIMRLPLLPASPWEITLPPAYQLWVQDYVEYINVVNRTIAELMVMPVEAVYTTYDVWRAAEPQAALALEQDLDSHFNAEPNNVFLPGEVMWCPRPLDRHYRLGVLALLKGIESYQPVPNMAGVTIAAHIFPEDADARIMTLTNSKGEEVQLPIDADTMDRYFSTRFTVSPLGVNPLCPWIGLAVRDRYVGLLSYFGTAATDIRRLDTWRPCLLQPDIPGVSDCVAILPSGVFAGMGFLQGEEGPRLVLQFTHPMKMATGATWDITEVLPPLDATARAHETPAELYMRSHNPALVVTRAGDAIIVTDFHETVTVLRPCQVTTA